VDWSEAWHMNWQAIANLSLFSKEFSWGLKDLMEPLYKSVFNFLKMSLVKRNVQHHWRNWVLSRSWGVTLRFKHFSLWLAKADSVVLRLSWVVESWRRLKCFFKWFFVECEAWCSFKLNRCWVVICWPWREISSEKWKTSVMRYWKSRLFDNLLKSDLR